MMIRSKLVIGIAVMLFIAITGSVWWWLNQKGRNLRDDLPLAPRGYMELEVNREIEKQMSPEFRDRYQKQFESALSIIKEHPDSFLGWMDLGFVKNVFGDYRGAEAAWLYATEISPSQSRSLMNLGDLYANKLKDYPRAEEMYQRAIEIEPFLVPAYRELATLYRFSIKSREEDAYRVLENGQRQSPNEGVELLALAATWAEQDGKIPLAISYYEEFLKIQPDNARVKEDLARLKAKNQ